MERYLTPEQAAEALAIRPRTIREWLRTGRLHGLKAGKQWRIAEADLEEFLKGSSST